MMVIVDANTVFGFWPKRKLDASAGDLITRLDAAGGDRALTCSIRGWLYSFKEGNDETWATCRRHRDRLIPVATINPSTYFGVREEVDRVIETGFRMIRFFPVEQEWHVTQRHFGRLVEKLAETDLVLMIPSTEGVTTLATVFKDFPNPVVIETVRAYPHLAELIVCAQETPNLMIEMHLVGGMDFVETMVAEIGADRLLYGSGAPMHCISSSLTPILNAQIPARAKEKILSGNALRILGRES